MTEARVTAKILSDQQMSAKCPKYFIIVFGALNPSTWHYQPRVCRQVGQPGNLETFVFELVLLRLEALPKARLD